MKQGSTLFLKIVIVLIAVVVFTGMLWFPQTEGKATNLDLISIYTDPLIIYTYIASVPFFFGLYQAFKLLNFIDANRAFSQGAIQTLKNMKFAAFSLIVCIAIALLYIRFIMQGDDPAGPTVLGMSLILAFGVIGTAAAVFEKLLQNAVDIKSEHDLTV